MVYCSLPSIYAYIIFFCSLQKVFKTAKLAELFIKQVYKLLQVTSTSIIPANITYILHTHAYGIQMKRWERIQKSEDRRKKRVLFCSNLAN